MSVKTIMKRLEKTQHESKSDKETKTKRRKTKGCPIVISSLLHYHPWVYTHCQSIVRSLLSVYFYIKVSACFTFRQNTCKNLTEYVQSVWAAGCQSYVISKSKNFSWTFFPCLLGLHKTWPLVWVHSSYHRCALCLSFYPHSPMGNSTGLAVHTLTAWCAGAEWLNSRSMLPLHSEVWQFPRVLPWIKYRILLLMETTT